jgi:hypothetical protein
MIVAVAVIAAMLVGVVMLIACGFRAGDKTEDAVLVNLESRMHPRGVEVTVENPGPAAVLVGLTLRRPGIRLGLEGPAYARLRSKRTTRDLLPSHMATIGVVEAGQTERFVVPADFRLGRRSELVAAIGQQRRLRTIHRSVFLPQTGFHAPAIPQQRTPSPRPLR